MIRDCRCGQTTCTDCAETAAIAAMMRDEFTHSERQARLPAPEVVWLRAQMRAREEASRAATRPILFSQAMAIAALIGLLTATVGRMTLPRLTWAIETTPEPGRSLAAMVIALGCSLVLVPLVVYVALSKD